jgi:F-type H+-transporting ATPase subunit b
LLQETAQLEAGAFGRRQQVALAAEVKAVLDSWVRFEQQEKENEQARLVKTIVDNVLKSVSEDKTQKDVLAWAVSEVDREYTLFHLHHRFFWLLTTGGDDVAELVKTKAI